MRAGLSMRAEPDRGRGAMEEGEVCIVCGRRPDSFYVRVDGCAQRNCILCSLFVVDIDRLTEDHSETAGIVCLNCLLAYRQRDASLLTSAC